MDKEQTEIKTRSKLTLKLKLPSSSEPKSVANTSSENTRISNSLVQVTIKGRKKEAAPDQRHQSASRNLSNSEFEARKKAVSNMTTNSEDLTDEHDVLSKIRNSEPQKSQDTTKKIEPEESPIKIESEESSPEEIKEVQEVQEIQKVKEEVKAAQEAPTTKEVQEEFKEAPAIKEVAQDKVETPAPYQVDDFDVRGKIRKSIADANLLKEQREKVVEERKKVALEKEIIEKKKFKKPSKVATKFDEEEVKKKTFDNKKEKFGSRRMLKTFIVDDERSGYRKDRRKGRSRKKDTQDYKKIINEVILPELISVSDLSERMAEKTGDVVKKLFLMGVVATSNQVIDADTAELIIEEFGHTVKRIKDSDVEDAVIADDEDDNLEQLERAPVVTIMGHVDHGKTSLLDALRSTDVVSGESGGITQHIGASRIKTSQGKYITFLDTPGHEAFTQMRSRGADATDIIILVVAADDGVKAQTIEAISHAKASGAPIIVAVNKIDKPNADPSRVRNELLKHEIVSEDMGGDVIFVEVSAKAKTNLDKLEEIILLQAEILELKAPYLGRSSGVVIETKVDSSKGVMATFLVQKGTLDIGDIIVAGTAFGKVKKMHDDKGRSIKQATPSMPVEVLGLDFAPDSGDLFMEVNEEKQARDIIAYREKKKRDDKNLQNVAKTTEDIFKQAGDSATRFLPIIIKGDVHGSVEAIVGSLSKINTDEVAVKIVHSATGGINEGDVSLAAVSGAIIIGFNVRPNAQAKNEALAKNIDIRCHSIIYNVVDELKLILGGMLDPIRSEEHLGRAEIRQIFKVSGSGKIAGCSVIDGVIKKGSKVRLLRENVVVYEGILGTLKRFKEDVKEAKTGFECGIALDNFEDIKEKDIIECYEVIEKKRTL
ncbi:MAG: translation initiation factor IF-2 [Myxococcota bacterium]